MAGTSGEFEERERALLAATDELVITGQLADQRYAALAEHLDQREIVEVVLTISFYRCVSRVLAGLGVQLEPEYEDPRGSVA